MGGPQPVAQQPADPAPMTLPARPQSQVPQPALPPQERSPQERKELTEPVFRVPQTRSRENLVEPVFRVTKTTDEQLEEARQQASSVTLSVRGSLSELRDNYAELPEVEKLLAAARTEQNPSQWNHFAVLSRMKARREVLEAFGQNAGTLLNESERALQLAGGDEAAKLQAIGRYRAIAAHGTLSFDYAGSVSQTDHATIARVVREPWFSELNNAGQEWIVASLAVPQPNSHPAFQRSLATALLHPNFAQLTITEKERFCVLATRLHQHDIKDLVDLLTTVQPNPSAPETAKPVILSQDLREPRMRADDPKTADNTLLKYLYDFSGDSTVLRKVDGIDFNQERLNLTLELLQECNRFNLVDQSTHGTCVATSLEHSAALNQPAELVRLVTGLFSGDSTPLTRGIDLLTAPDNAFRDDGSGRTRVERVLQAALMDLGGRKEATAFGPQWRYDNANDRFYNSDDPTETRQTGLSSVGATAIFDSFYGHTHSRVTSDGTAAQSGALIQALREATAPGQAPRRIALALIIPATADRPKSELHAVSVLGIDRNTALVGRLQVTDERLLFRNPWGVTHLPKGTTLPEGMRVEDGPQGIYSLPLDALKQGESHEARWAVIEQPPAGAPTERGRP